MATLPFTFIDFIHLCNTICIHCRLTHGFWGDTGYIPERIFRITEEQYHFVAKENQSDFRIVLRHKVGNYNGTRRLPEDCLCQCIGSCLSLKLCRWLVVWLHIVWQRLVATTNNYYWVYLDLCVNLSHLLVLGHCFMQTGENPHSRQG